MLLSVPSEGKAPCCCCGVCGFFYCCCRASEALLRMHCNDVATLNFSCTARADTHTRTQRCSRAHCSQRTPASVVVLPPLPFVRNVSVGVDSVVVVILYSTTPVGRLRPSLVFARGMVVKRTRSKRFMTSN